MLTDSDDKAVKKLDAMIESESVVTLDIVGFGSSFGAEGEYLRLREKYSPGAVGDLIASTCNNGAFKVYMCQGNFDDSVEVVRLGEWLR